MTIGLTLGKYAPLHRGHQHVIETAIAENDHVIVVIYNAPDVARCPLHVRANWIRLIYPQIEVIEAWDGPIEVSQDPEITAVHDAYLQKLLVGRDISRFYSSEVYGQHVSLALDAEDRRVDPDRVAIPVSGTQIRQDLFQFRDYLDPIVYRDLITKVVFLGAPSTGKTTIAERLANEYQTVWMPEYGREYWERHQVNRRLTRSQLTEIATEHRRREDSLCQQANRFMFVDTDATTTLLFSRYYHGDAEAKLVEMADQTRDRYDLFFVCQTDIDYDDSWDRSGEVHRQEFHRLVEADLRERDIPFIRLSGDLRERTQIVRRRLESSAKFGNPGGPS